MEYAFDFRKVCHSRFIVVYFLTECFYLWYQYPGPTLKKSFMIANIYNFLRAFHTFLYKIGGHVCRHFVVKQRVYCKARERKL